MYPESDKILPTKKYGKSSKVIKILEIEIDVGPSSVLSQSEPSTPHDQDEHKEAGFLPGHINLQQQATSTNQHG